MTTGFYVIYVTPGIETSLLRPDEWDTTFETGEQVERYNDRLEWADTEPDENYPLAPGEWIAEVLPNVILMDLTMPITKWRVRVRFPEMVNDTRGGIVPLYILSDPKLPVGWDNAARFWGVHTTAANHKTLHEHIYTTLGYGPVAGAWAALDPDDGTQFLPDAVRTALDMTNQEFLTRLTTTANQLAVLGYTPTELQAIVDVPAGKTEDDTMRALVHDMGFTMAQLKNAAIRMD